ncbi:hypothetical protein D3C72_1553500 [compost metagenome]
MFTPQQAAVFGGQCHHPIGELFHQHFLLGIAHVQRGTHMQHAGIDVTEHAVAEVVAVQQLTEFDDVIGQMLRRHAGVFGKGNRFGPPFGVTQ